MNHLHGCIDCRLVFAHGSEHRGKKEAHRCPGCGGIRGSAIFNAEVADILAGRIPKNYSSAHALSGKGWWPKS